MIKSKHILLFFIFFLDSTHGMQPDVPITPNNGIININASCFIHAALQILYHLQPVRNFFIQANHLNLYNPHSTSALCIQFITRLSERPDFLYSNYNSAINPETGKEYGPAENIEFSRFRKNIVTLAQAKIIAANPTKNDDEIKTLIDNDPIASMGEGNQDAREFFFHCIDSLETDLINNSTTWKPFIQNIFKITYQNKYTCSICNNTTQTQEYNGSLTLTDNDNALLEFAPENKKSPITMLDLITNIFTEESIEAECEPCKKNGKATIYRARDNKISYYTKQTKQKKLKDFPPILFIQSSLADIYTTHNINFIYPYTLTFKPAWCQQSISSRIPQYTLIGTITKDEGHYWNYIHYGTTCYRYDDNAITSFYCNANMITNQPEFPGRTIDGRPYLLVYHRNDIPQNYQHATIPANTSSSSSNTKTTIPEIIISLEELLTQLIRLQFQLESLKIQLEQHLLSKVLIAQGFND